MSTASSLVAKVKNLVAKAAFKLFSREQLYMLSDFLSPFVVADAKAVKDETIALYEGKIGEYLNPSFEIEKGLHIGIFVDTNGNPRPYISKEPVTDEIVTASNEMREARSSVIAKRVERANARKEIPQKPQRVSNTFTL